MDELDLLDWRRRVFGVYDEIRTSGPRVGHVRWRAVRDELFGKHPQSPLDAGQRARFKGLRYWEYDPAFRFAARLRARPGARFEIQTSTGETMFLRKVGVLELPLGTLNAYWIDVYGGGLFVPFKDATSGRTTYGGGRYLLDTIKGADLGSNERGELIVDLNFAYHPSCHYSYRWSCPLAAPDDRLDVEVNAGEMSYEGDEH